MTTLVIEDASRDLQAQIAEAKARRANLGITPIEHRPARIANRPTVVIAGDVKIAELARVLLESGFEIANAGGMQIIRKVRI